MAETNDKEVMSLRKSLVKKYMEVKKEEVFLSINLFNITKTINALMEQKEEMEKQLCSLTSIVSFLEEILKEQAEQIEQESVESAVQAILQY